MSYLMVLEMALVKTVTIAINAINKLLVIKDITGREIDLALAKEGEPLEDFLRLAGQSCI